MSGVFSFLLDGRDWGCVLIPTTGVGNSDLRGVVVGAWDTIPPGAEIWTLLNDLLFDFTYMAYEG